MGSQALDERKPDRIEIEFHSGSLAIVALIGEHDLGRHESLKEALENAAARRRNIIVDLSSCSFIDSTTVTLLVRAERAVVSESGQFAVVIPHHRGPVARTADMMRLAELFPLDAALADAITRITHVTRIRDLRESYSDAEAFAAECSCGWTGDPQTGTGSRVAAGNDALEHTGTRAAG